MLNLKIVQLFILVSAFFSIQNETQSQALKELSETEKINYIKGFVKTNFNLLDNEIPIFVFDTNLNPKHLGEFDPKKNTISLHPNALINQAILESTIVHEIHHFQISTKGSKEFDERVNSMTNVIRSKFDICRAVDEFKPYNKTPSDIIEIVRGQLKPHLEEIYVSELTLEFNNYTEKERAIAVENQVLKLGKQNLDAFWTGTIELIGKDINGVIFPKNKNNTTNLNDDCLGPLSGNYECVNCDGPYPKPGTYNQPSGNMGTYTFILSPLVVENTDLNIKLYCQSEQKSSGFVSGDHTHGPTHSIVKTVGFGKLKGNEVEVTSTVTIEIVQELKITRNNAYSNDPTIRQSQIDHDNILIGSLNQLKKIGKPEIPPVRAKLIFLEDKTIKQIILDGEFKGKESLYKKMNN